MSPGRAASGLAVVVGALGIVAVRVGRAAIDRAVCRWANVTEDS